MREYEADILRTEPKTTTTILIELSCGPLAAQVMPGQFLQLRATGATDPFLRRTISVAGADRENGTVSLLIEQVGPGTRLLCNDRFGPVMNVIGPLGNSFAVDIADDREIVLVAGGIGAAPMVFLANELAARGRRNLTFFMGARHADGLGGIDGLLPVHMPLIVSTDDGSAGHHGVITDKLADYLETTTDAVIYTCGPKPMMRRVAGIAGETGCRCQVSLEERMACGFGACYGCAVKLTDGSVARVCKDGPVFEGGEVVWS